MALHNVVQMKQYAAYNVDSYNRTVVAEVDLDNGCVFKLEEYSTNVGEGTVWKAAQAAETDTGLWMAMAPEVVTTELMDGVYARNLIKDPRAFTNIKGKCFDAILLHKGDIIEMTCEGIENADTNDYLVPDTADFKLKAQGAAGTGLCLHKIGTSRLHIGNANLVKSFPVTYKYEVVNN